MAVITDQVDIEATPAAVWSVLMDAKRMPDFSDSTVAVEQAPDELRRKGDTFVQVVRVLGKRWRCTWTVVDLQVEQLLRTEGVAGPGIKLQLTQQVEPRGDASTRLRLEIHYPMVGGRLGRAISSAGLERRAQKEAAAIMNGVRSAAEAGHPTPVGT